VSCKLVMVIEFRLLELTLFCFLFRSALTELCVLSDILKLSQQKKYLVLDPVQADLEPPRTAVTLIYKKKVTWSVSTWRIF